MIIEKRGEVMWFKSKLLSKYPHVRHAFSTRLGGTSAGSYSSLNLAFSTGDIKEKVSANREAFFSTVKIDTSTVCRLKQQLGSTVVAIDRPDTYKGDSLVTNKPQVSLLTLSADCLLLLMFDPKKNVIANCHASRLGTQSEITLKTIQLMIEKYGCSAEDILVSMCATIGKCCYEIGSVKVNDLKNTLSYVDKFFNGNRFDIAGANLHQALSMGVRDENIESKCLCTRCNEPLFFSYRRDGAESGRHGAIISL